MNERTLRLDSVVEYLGLILDDASIAVELGVIFVSGPDERDVHREEDPMLNAYDGQITAH